MSNDPILPARTGFTSCHQCGNSIDVSDQASLVDQIGHFVRLRCVQPECLRTDWYTDSEIEPPAGSEAEDNQESQVWVHDLLLGVSFRDPGGRV